MNRRGATALLFSTPVVKILAELNLTCALDLSEQCFGVPVNLQIGEPDSESRAGLLLAS